MKRWLQIQRLNSLLRQRNLLVSVSLLITLSNIVLAMALLTQNEHVVLVPPAFKQPLWVERQQVSKAYLEEVAVFLAGLILTVSAGSAAYQHDILLRYTTPESYGALKAQLLKDQERLKKDNTSTVFRPHDVAVDGARQRVWLSGDLMHYVGDKRVSQKRETYELSFLLRRGQLQLQSFHYREDFPHEP